VTGAPATTSTRRLPRARSRAAQATTEAALAPVVSALLASAQARARAILADGEEDARAELSRARAEADHLLAEAAAGGAEAAARTAAVQLATARRQARGMILVARRRAYDALRTGAIETLARQATTPEGRRLADHLVTLVSDRVGASASVRRVGSDSLTALAEGDNRRAVLGPAALVDQALMALADEIESLWA